VSKAASPLHEGNLLHGMNQRLREFFDEHLEVVLKRLPARVHALLDEVPLVVEDHPSASLMRKLGLRGRSHLCGLYTGIPLTQRSIEHSGIPSDVIHIFRQGILDLSQDPCGSIDRDELQRQIRITILHELGHHHGLDEDELEQLGY
jgi:predicted Zn-dependent protease with MMP-like domain